MLSVCFDMQVSPPTYDTVSALCRAESERLARGEDSLRIVHLVNGFRRDKLWPHGIEAKRHMLERVAKPLCWLLPSVGEVVESSEPDMAMFGTGRRLYGFAEQVRACKAGIRPLRVRGAVVRDPRLVTITLRQAEHWPERNSNLPEWLSAAQQLRSDGLRVVFVPETDAAEFPVLDFETDPEAARHIPARATLYAGAALNLFVSNGPAWMCMAMDAPTVIFKPATEGLLRVFRASYFRQCGVEPGGQMPGAPDYQRIVWQPDRANVIVPYVQTMLRTLN